MAQIDTKDPKALGAGLLLCAGLVGSGSMLFLEEELKTCRADLSARDAKNGARQSQKGGK